MYKYLSAYSGEILDRRIMKEIDEKRKLDDFLNSSLCRAKLNYHSGGTVRSVRFCRGGGRLRRGLQEARAAR